jgi:hypothetical protein
MHFARTPRKTACIVDKSLFIAPLPSNIFPIVSRACFCGNVFSDPLPINGHGADHIENNSCNTFSIVACAYFGRGLEMGLRVTYIVILARKANLLRTKTRCVACNISERKNFNEGYYEIRYCNLMGWWCHLNEEKRGKVNVYSYDMMLLVLFCYICCWWC